MDSSNEKKVVSSECTAEKTEFQPTGAKWSCPVCGYYGDRFGVGWTRCANVQCDDLHVDDEVSCDNCDSHWVGQEVANLMEFDNVKGWFDDHMGAVLDEMEYAPGGTVRGRLEDLQEYIADFVDGLHKIGINNIEKDGLSSSMKEGIACSCASIAVRALVLADTVRRKG